MKYFLTNNLVICSDLLGNFNKFIELNVIKEKFKSCIKPYYVKGEFILYKDQKFYKQTNLNTELYLNMTKDNLLTLFEKKEAYSGFDSEGIFKFNESTLVGVRCDEETYITIYLKTNIDLEEIILNYCLFGDLTDLNQLFSLNEKKLRSIIEI